MLGDFIVNFVVYKCKRQTAFAFKVGILITFEHTAKENKKSLYIVCLKQLEISS